MQKAFFAQLTRRPCLHEQKRAVGFYRSRSQCIPSNLFIHSGQSKAPSSQWQQVVPPPPDQRTVPQKSKNWLYAHLDNLGSSFWKCQNATLSLSTLSQQRKNRSFKVKSTSLLFRHVSKKMISKPGNFFLFLHVTLVYWHEQCVLSRLLASKSCNHISMVKEKGTSNGHRIERQRKKASWGGGKLGSTRSLEL